MRYKDLYNFRPHPNGFWRVQFTVAAETPENALNAVIEHLKRKAKKEEEYKPMYREWKSAKLERLPDDYSYRELYSYSEVLETNVDFSK